MDKKYKKKDFKTPEGYFESFTDKLLDRMAEEEANFPKKEGFAVPEDYFEGLDKRILTRLDEKPETKVVQLRSYRKYVYAAASIAAIFLLVFGLQWNSNTPPEFDLTESEIDAYFENTDLGLSSYELAEVLSEDELRLEDFLENTVDEENIMEYLDENLDDFDELEGDFDELNFDSDE